MMDATTNKPHTQARNIYRVPQDAVEMTALLIAALPTVSRSTNGMARLASQQAPVQTLGELWRVFVACGLSSQESGEPGSPLDRFIRAQGAVFDLDWLRTTGGSPEAIRKEIHRHLPRHIGAKTALVIGALQQFSSPDAVSDTPLAALPEDIADGLRIFRELAVGMVDDYDLVASETFSRSLNTSPWPYIGDKQLRNILVNSGLARNVVPLDSRWRNFFGPALTFGATHLASTRRYLEIEHVLRRALLVVQRERSDIKNLAHLDAVVFEHMSRAGAGIRIRQI